MNFLINDFKNAFRQRGNYLPKIIIINVVIWLFTVTLYIMGPQAPEYFRLIFSVPNQLGDLIYRPWTPLTSMFIHGGLGHIFFNMLLLYWFGRIVVDFVNDKKFISVYILGGLFGVLCYLIIYNVVPKYAATNAILYGASGAVYAVAVAAATLAPEHRVNLLFFGPVRIVYVAAFGIAISYASAMQGANTGGNIAHLGGALMGYLYVKQLRAGKDMGRPIVATIDFFNNLFSSKPKLKVTRNPNAGAKKTTSAKGAVSQAEIDKILDKINQSGYESLTKEEKEKLFSASNNKGR